MDGILHYPPPPCLQWLVTFKENYQYWGKKSWKKKKQQTNLQVKWILLKISKCRHIFKYSSKSYFYRTIIHFIWLYKNRSDFGYLLYFIFFKWIEFGTFSTQMNRKKNILVPLCKEPCSSNFFIYKISESVIENEQNQLWSVGKHE